jgi:hypothetical protein
MKSIKTFLKKNIKDIIIVVLVAILAVSISQVEKLSGNNIVGYRYADSVAFYDIIDKLGRIDITPESEVSVIGDAAIVVEHADIPYKQELGNALREAQAAFELRMSEIENNEELEKHHREIINSLWRIANIYNWWSAHGDYDKNSNEEFEQYYKDYEEDIMEDIRIIKSSSYYILNYELAQSDSEKEIVLKDSDDEKEIGLEDSEKMVVADSYLEFCNCYMVFKEVTVCMQDGSTVEIIKDNARTELVEKIVSLGVGTEYTQQIVLKEKLDTENIKSIILNGVEYPY